LRLFLLCLTEADPPTVVPSGRVKMDVPGEVEPRERDVPMLSVSLSSPAALLVLAEFPTVLLDPMRGSFLWRSRVGELGRDWGGEKRPVPERAMLPSEGVLKWCSKSDGTDWEVETWMVDPVGRGGVSGESEGWCWLLSVEVPAASSEGVMLMVGGTSVKVDLLRCECGWPTVRAIVYAVMSYRGREDEWCHFGQRWNGRDATGWQEAYKDDQEDDGSNENHWQRSKEHG
jgi:hypothetical protein